MVVDAHTHRPSRKQGLFEIESLDLQSVSAGHWKESGPFTVGLHPWWLHRIKEDDAKRLIFELAKHDNCLGIGETGLDKVIEISLSEQLRWLQLHLEWVALFEKPLLVLHVVRAFSEVRAALKAFKYNAVILIHDCAAPPSEMAQFEKDERFWFSYGSSLFREGSRGYQGFLHAPKDRILFETDDTGKTIDAVSSKGFQVVSQDQLILNEKRFLGLIGR